PPAGDGPPGRLLAAPIQSDPRRFTARFTGAMAGRAAQHSKSLAGLKPRSAGVRPQRPTVEQFQRARTADLNIQEGPGIRQDQITLYYSARYLNSLVIVVATTRAEYV